MDVFLKKKFNLLFLLLVLFLGGCSTLDKSDMAKIALVPNLAGTYWSTVATHEYSHKLFLDIGGANDVTVHLTPRTDGNNRFQIAQTSFKPSDISKDFFQLASFSGPGSNFLQSILFRSALRFGLVPKFLQPTFAWIDVGGRVLSYYHAFAGISNLEGADLSRVEEWIPWTFLAINIIYDIGSFILSDDDLETYFGVLFGEKFYDEPGFVIRF